ncbi:MAG: aminotransferase class V-fold PLP-dependent enzyme [Pirellulales bacterium]
MGVYEQLGLKTIVNASGAVTRLGGAPMEQAVLDALVEASAKSVPLEKLQAAASRRIAAATGTEAGLVTAGAASALTLGAAAILCGYDAARMEQLPHCQGFPHEFVVAREQRNGYDHAVRAAGARLVEVGFHEQVANAGVRRAEAWEYATAFGPGTAGVLYVYGPNARPPLAEVVAAAHARGLSVLVDAAGELPPRSNLKSIAASGADLVAFSGGKAIRGPQGTGILCGRRDLIGSAALQLLDMDDHYRLWEPPAELIDRTRLTGMPRHGIGRAHKVAKEQIVALLTALELFTGGHYDRKLAGYRDCLRTIVDALANSPAQCKVIDPDDGETIPLLEIAIDESAEGGSALDVCRNLRSGEPPCYVGQGRLDEGRLTINPLHLDRQAAMLLATRIKELLRGPALKAEGGRRKEE